MEVFVQSRTFSDVYRWVRVLQSGENEPADSLSPYAGYAELTRFIDPYGESIVLAVLPGGLPAVLIKGIPSERRLRENEQVTSSTFVVFESPAALARAQGLTACFLDQTTSPDEWREHSIFSWEVVQAFETCVIEVNGKIHVRNSLHPVLEARCGTHLPVADTASFTSMSRFAKNTAERRKELVHALRTQRLAVVPRGEPIPLVVVTGAHSGSKSLGAGVQFLLTETNPHDAWESVPAAREPEPVSTDYIRQRDSIVPPTLTEISTYFQNIAGRIFGRPPKS